MGVRLKEKKGAKKEGGGVKNRQNMDNFTFTVHLKYLFNSCLVEFNIHMKWHFVSVSFELLLGFLSCSFPLVRHSHQHSRSIAKNYDEYNGVWYRFQMRDR